MTTPLKDLAIQCALENKWKEAAEINKQILDENPRELDSLNRLAYSYLKMGQYKEAKNTYSEVLSLDPTNPIATKNMKKLTSLASQKGNSGNHQIQTNHMDNVFIQEAGKTKTVELTNLADKKTLLILQHGDEVILIVKRSRIFVQTIDKLFIGMLPDSLGIRLVAFIQGGNEYQACIKSVDDKNVTVFIKEVKRSKKFVNQPSFT